MPFILIVIYFHFLVHTELEPSQETHFPNEASEPEII